MIFVAAEAGIDLNLFLNFEQKWSSYSGKIVLMNKKILS